MEEPNQEDRWLRWRQWWHNLRGDQVELELHHDRRQVARIRACSFGALRDAELTRRARALADDPASDESRRIELCALVVEACRRRVGLDLHDCQLLAGLALMRDRVVQLPTGEGKTLAGLFPAAYFGGTGPVHVLTFNDYLARRDAAWLGPALELLGLRVGCVQEGQSPAEKRRAYGCDVTYATAKEAGFDYLRDGLALHPDQQVQRPFHAALVDEADSILIDEARIPLVIAGRAEPTDDLVDRIEALVRHLLPGRDLETDAEHRNVFLTEQGARRLEQALGCASLYDPDQQPLLQAIHCGLQAHMLLRRDIDYIVRGDRIEIVDEFTGRVVEQRHWPDGLQAAVEAKEGLPRGATGRILSSITLQHLLGLYPHLAGMTATAYESAAEFRERYGLGVTVVPPHAPNRRVDLPDAVFVDAAAKQQALVAEIRQVHATGQPILVGTLSVQESEALAAALEQAGVPCVVLNARNDEQEATLIAQAGQLGAVTISTNMAGRGTDIRLGGADEARRAEVVARGGLYVIGTNRHESRRIDRQLRGRAGRQGDPGRTRFFVSFTDDLFFRYGLTGLLQERHGRATAGSGPPESDHERVLATLEHAQRVIEGQCGDIRRALAEFSTVIDRQRQIIRERRDELLRGEEADALPALPEPELGCRASARWTTLARSVRLCLLDETWRDQLAWLTDRRESIHLESLAGRSPLQEFEKSATLAFLERLRELEERIPRELARLPELDEAALAELEATLGPSSTWTYLVNEDQLDWAAGLLRSANQGFTAVAAALQGPLFLFWLLVRRWRSRQAG